MATDSLPHDAQALGFEARDVSTRGLLYFLLAVGIFLIITAFVVVGLFSHYEKSDLPRPEVRSLFGSARPLPPAPRIQVAPGDDIQNYREAEQQFLSSSGWIDQKNGIARISIDRAMELLLRNGLPTRNEPSVTAGEQKIINSNPDPANNRSQETP
jgi:hypothetical protein